MSKMQNQMQNQRIEHYKIERQIMGGSIPDDPEELYVVSGGSIKDDYNIIKENMSERTEALKDLFLGGGHCKVNFATLKKLN